MEKAPDFRVVSNVPFETKEQARGELQRALYDHFESLPDSAKSEVEKLEYPKSKEELVVLNFVNKATNELMEKYGLEPYSVPADNFHLMPHDFFRERIGEGQASTFYLKQGIILDAKKFRARPVKFGAVAYHELLHSKGHTAIEVEEKLEGKLEEKEKNGKRVLGKSLYRTGLSVHSALRSDDLTGASHEHFRGLHEAVVSTQQKKFVNTMIDLPIFSADKEWIKSEAAKEIKQKIAKDRKIAEDDIYWVDRKGKNFSEIHYSKARKVLAYVLKKIQKEFPEQFASPDDVFEKFLEAQFTGKLLNLARLVDSTFGKGGFRILGNMEDNDTSPPLILENLMRNRSQFLRKKKDFEKSGS